MKNSLHALTQTGLVAAALWAAALTQAQVPNFITITNPSPIFDDRFGRSLAGVGTYEVVIGAPYKDVGASDSGAAYLFDIDGTLLTTFKHAKPVAHAWLGSSVAAVGADRVLIGAPGDLTGPFRAGAAYLFHTSGALLTTLTNPSPVLGEQFGFSVAAVGADCVLIGDPSNMAAPPRAGAAYLISTNGTLITTFTNLAPKTDDKFGISVAAVGTDRVLIGASGRDEGATNAGAAYLFSTNGALLTVFTNPAPAAGAVFGECVAAVGADRVLVGAPSADAPGAGNAGAAYLFSVDGTLITTFTNPTPAYGEFFAESVAALGTDRVVIGSSLDGRPQLTAGAAHVFSIDGRLLTTITNPTPAYSDFFGLPVAAVGTDRVLIGAHLEDGNQRDIGAAYLFDLGPATPAAPQLSISQAAAPPTVTLAWPASAVGWGLENADEIPSDSVNGWRAVPPPYQTNGEMISVTFTNNAATGNAFFRLHQP